MDTASISTDTTRFSTPNPFVMRVNNYETFNNSFITGNSYALIRSEDNPQILLDGIPMNPWIGYNTHYAEFLGSMNVLSYDLQQAEVTTLQSNGRIISGSYNNAINFKTYELMLGKSSPKFAVNNFSTIDYQDFDTLGLSTVINISARQSFKKLGYRLSVNNGFQNDYIPKNGLQRYGGNLKFKYQPHESVMLNCFVDFTSFLGFKREDNVLKSNRLISYLDADITLTKSITLHGKYSLNNVSDFSERYLFNGEAYGRNYHNKLEYRYRTSYSHVGLSFHEKIMEKANLNVDFGYSNLKVNYINERETFNGSGDGYTFNSRYAKASPGEQTLYASFKLSNKVLSIQGLYNLTTSVFSKTPVKEDENKLRNNYLLSLKYDPIKNNDKIINGLGFQFDYARLINYSILMFSPDWVINSDNDNIQFGIYGSLLKNRVNVNFSVYQKNYDRFMKLFASPTGFSWMQDIGTLKKYGYNVNGNFHIIEASRIKWNVELEYTQNNSKLALHENLPVLLSDTVIHNKLIMLVNHLQYRNLHLSFALEGKNGYDVSLYDRNIMASEPYAVYESYEVTGVTNEGKPVVREIENPLQYIPDTDYFILKQLGLDYEFTDSKNHKYSVGLQYNKLRRLYLYVNDIDFYQSQFQRPSFYSAVSLTFSMLF